MEMKLGVLADFATIGANGKLIIVGIYDTIFAVTAGPVQIISAYLVLTLEAPAPEGSDHQIEVQLWSEDKPLAFRQALPAKLAPGGRGRPLRGNVFVALFMLPLPGPGNYEFHVMWKGRQLGTVPLQVVVGPPPAGR